MKFLAVLVWAFVLPAFSQTICTTKEIPKFDPHQSWGPLESYIASRIYLPFFQTKTASGVIASTRLVRDKVWELEVSPGITFQELGGWKPKRGLNAQDVVFSLERQLARNSKTIAAQESFIPAKLTGFEKEIASIKATGSMKVELTFRRQVTQTDLERFFSFPVGTVISQEYANSGRPTPFYPAYGKFRLKSITPSRITLSSGDGKETQTLLFLRSFGLTYKTVQESKCKRLYYPPLDMVQAVKEKKIAATAIPVSTGKLYFRFNPVFAFASDVSPLLSWSLRPDAFSSLAGRRLTNQFFGSTKIPAKPKKMNLPNRSAYVYYCRFPQISENELEGFVSDFTSTLRDNLRIGVSLAPVDCDQLAGIRPAPDTLGVLNIFEYQKKSDLLDAFDCGKISTEIFGTCQENGLKPEVIDRKLGDLKRIYPIAEIDSYLIEVI